MIRGAQSFKEWSKGETVQVKEWKGQYKILEITVYSNGDMANFTVVKVKPDGTIAKKSYTGVYDRQLMKLDEIQSNTDNNGLTASQTAEELCKNGFVFTDWYNTTSERLAKVINISKAGRIKVKEVTIINGRVAKYAVHQGENTTVKVRDIETDYINYADLEYKEDEKEMTFTPRLFNGEWKFWCKDKVLKSAKMKITQLLD